MADETPHTPDPAALPELLTVAETMEILRIGRRQLHRLTREGLPSVQISPRVIRFPRDGVQEFLRQRTRTTVGAPAKEGR